MNDMSVKNVMLVGVGGQGTILASKLLTLGLLEAGFDVRMSEIHGMSQRGGSVSSMVRYGDKVLSPVVEIGSADILVSFEKLEALRNLSYLKPDGIVVVNDYQISPMGVLSLAFEYPDSVLERLSLAAKTIVINANEVAESAGSSKVMNTVLLGVIAKYMDLGDINWAKLIESNVKAAYIDMNIRAFQAGFNFKG
jgi:indolepyruvate ferredoxin oxidoreductase beta subunit